MTTIMKTTEIITNGNSQIKSCQLNSAQYPSFYLLFLMI